MKRAEEFKATYHSSFKFPEKKQNKTKTLGNRSSNSVGSGSSEETVDMKEALIIEDGHYRVSKKYKFIHPVYEKSGKRPIVRGYYFTPDVKPIDENIAKDINEHLNDHLKNQQSGAPKTLVISQTIIHFDSVVDFTIKDGENAPLTVSRYPRHAEWKNSSSKTKNLLFVVHGVFHDENEASIEESARDLRDNLCKQMHSATLSVTVIPIHWRTGLTDSSHKCDDGCFEKSNGIVDYLINWFINKVGDVELYQCKTYGDKIRNRIIDNINEQYETFLSLNEGFMGNVSFFGHSLGSVIFYDILTMDSLKGKLKFGEVKHLFLAGSPLNLFLNRRGDEAKERFRKAQNELRIHNIYTSCDLIRLGGELSENDMEPIDLPELSKPSYVKNAFMVVLKPIGSVLKPIGSVLESIGWKGNADGQWVRRIDYRLQGLWGPRTAHSIYWKHEAVSNYVNTVLAKDNYTYGLRNRTNNEQLQTGNSSEEKAGTSNDIN